MNIQFVQGSKNSVEARSTQDGQLLFTVDEGHIYLDNGTQRIELYKKDLDILKEALNNIDASKIAFDDGETFQEKLDKGELTGPQGEQGSPGVKGDKGDPGAQGPKGDAFTYSDFTSEQLAALKGPKGDDGTPGERGPQGLPGAAGTNGITPHIDSSSGNWYIGETDTGVKAQGPIGPQGPQGLTGAKGEKGDTGSVGPQGPQGLTGPAGPQGAVGPQGPKGDPGAGINPNLLTNWYFAHPINQRGKTEYTGKTYTIDRWEQDGTGKTTVSDDCITLTRTGTGFFLISQVIENYKDFIGKIITISAIVSGDVNLMVGYGTGYQGQVTHRGENTDLISWTVTFNPQATALNATLSPLEGATAKILAVKLELGDQQTLAHQDAEGNWVLNEIPDPALELAKCQRYYLRLTGDASAVAKNVILARQGAKNVEFFIPTPVPMRANPTFRIQGDVTLPNDASLSASGSAVAGENGVYFRVNDPSGGDDENANTLYPAALQFASDFLELDAEL